MKLISKVIVGIFTIGLAGALSVTPSQAAPKTHNTIGSATTQSVNTLTTKSLASPQPRIVVRTCPSGYFGFASYPVLANYLANTKHWVLNKKNVWQSPSENETWILYCQITNSSAVMNNNGSALTVSPSPVYLGDGTRIDFRTTSSSGGYTIDINRNGTIYKVQRS